MRVLIKGVCRCIIFYSLTFIGLFVRVYGLNDIRTEALLSGVKLAGSKFIVGTERISPVDYEYYSRIPKASTSFRV